MMSSKHIKCIKFNALYFLVLNKKANKNFIQEQNYGKSEKNKKGIG